MVTSVEKGSILIVDDEDLIRSSLRRKLAKEGYKCTEAFSGDDALNILEGYPADLVILDIKMPGKQGTEVLPEIKRDYPETAVIMATAVNDPQTIISCMKKGAHDYIPKPFMLDEVVLAVDNTFIKRRMEIELRKHSEELEQTVNDQGKVIRKLTLGSFEALINALESKDKYTAGHSRRVAQITEVIAHGLLINQDDLDNLRWGALLHDVGKIAIDPAIQNKPGKLTDEEYRHLMVHAQIGPEIVQPIANQEITEIIRCHHYRYDGQGIDQTVKGAEIPLGARIVAVADTYDAMTTDRPYRGALSQEVALNEIKRCSGTQFDPVVSAVFCSVFNIQIDSSKIGK